MQGWMVWVSCRREPSRAHGHWWGMTRSLNFAPTILTALVALIAPAVAQGFQPPATNYGYQPYNDRNPTGFYHPNDTGYGRYVYSPKTTGHRASSLNYRRFRGY